MYKLFKDPEGKVSSIQKGDSMWIPMVEDNTDYQEYLKWVAAGNTPEPADEE
jgi:hypothetical protein